MIRFYKVQKEKGVKMVEENLSLVSNSDLGVFKKFTKALSLFLLPSKLGYNSYQISRRRRQLVKAYVAFNETLTVEDASKKEKAFEKYENEYLEYLEYIDKYIMDSIRKKVMNGRASEFEKDALMEYHKVTSAKDEEFIEYKFRKQKYLLELDFNKFLEEDKTSKYDNSFKTLYIEKQDRLYKGILKNYSVKITDDRMSQKASNIQVYLNIFATIEEYLNKIIPIKFEIEGEANYKDILKEYDEFTTYSVGKLDEKAFLEKNMLLLSISRSLFTHSLPLVVAEQCYEKLLKDTRLLLVNTTNEHKQEKAYQMLLMLIEEYNVKLLSVKIYWENKDEREKNKKFWEAFTGVETEKEKEVLILLEELRRLKEENSPKMKKLKKIYKSKLSKLGVYKIIDGINKNFEGKTFKRFLVACN